MKLDCLKRLSKVLIDHFQGEKGRAVVRFWKAFGMALVASTLVPVASGADWREVLQFWPQLLATALLTGLGLGGEKYYRAYKLK